MNNRDRVGRARQAPVVVAIASALLAGCGPKATHEQAPAKPQAEATPSPSQGRAGEGRSVALLPVDRAGYDAAITKLHGKVVLVDFWATWCLPCVEQLPHTLELGQRFADRGLAVVTVSCDEPAEADRVTQFLNSKQAGGVTNLISQFGGSPRTMEEFEIASGAVPFYKLYDRTGKLRQTFGIRPTSKEQFTPAEIEAAIEQLLAE